MVDIKNRREEVFKLLYDLNPNALPEFGAMTPQHMVEHLSYTVRFSNGKLPQKLYYTNEKADKFKHYTIYTDRELVPGFKAPMLSDELYPLQHKNILEAVDELKLEFAAFDKYFLAQPETQPISPTLGELNHQEWIIFHNKHFTHHLKQFKLL